jgi:hypothetical protein
MPVKDPGKRRSTALAVAIVFALSGAGVAAAWAASEPAAQARDAAAQLAPSAVSPPPSPSPPGSPDKARAKARELHSESVVKNADGSFEKRVTQIGTVESVSDKAITVKSEDGFSQEYAISADTRIRKVPKPAAADPAPKDSPAPKDDAGKRLKPSAATAADLKQGDTVRIMGVQDGSAVTATIIVDGAANGKGLGKGLGQSLGKGLGQGQGKGLGRDNGQGNGRGQGRDDAEDGT